MPNATYPYPDWFYYIFEFKIQKSMKQAGAELGQAQQSWDWAGLN